MEAVIKNVEDIDVLYDRAQDVLYLSFGGISTADDSELTGKDIIIRYRKRRIVGLTVLEFSKRVDRKL
ncbi:MAG: DUF2283 domain-containing protein [Candidatus Hadarchaeum sp.]|uniref:DUF2283 domain-containing protein n=1 Tax=Candidatus Hadarchaeum sp. TaxID=2883567 RepID=UPI003D135BC2